VSSADVDAADVTSPVGPRPAHWPRLRWWWPVLAATGLVLGVRALGFEQVFVDDLVVFPPADPQYHLRRAFQVFETFPHVMLFDPYINHPGGAPIPWPPLFDWMVGAFAWLWASDARGFEIVAAWASPACAVFTCWPIALIARRTSGESGPRVAVTAISIFAFVPLLANYGRVGYADHHAAVAMIGAWLLLCCVALVDPALTRSGARRWGAALVLVRLALLLTWHGSLLYLGVAEAGLALFYAFTGRRRLATTQAASAAATAVLLLPVLAWMPTPLGGEYSAIALSRLHVLAMVAVAFVLAGVLALSRGERLATPVARCIALAGCSLAFVALAFGLPGPRAGLQPAIDFLAMSDGVGDVTGEQLPIFDLGGRAAQKPFALIWGWLAPIMPGAAIGAWLAGRRRPADSAERAGAWMLALWAGVFGALAVVQRRYGNDFGPSAAVGFALGFVLLGDAIGQRVAHGRRASAIGSVIACVLVVFTAWPAISRIHAPRAGMAWRALSGDPAVLAMSRSGVAVALTKFLLDVRARTPDTSGYFDDGGMPEYAVLAHPNLGHAVQYVARRATATDPFWAYIGPLNWERTQQLFATRNESEALDLAAVLHGRYLISMPQMPPGSIVQRLHDRDGAAQGVAPALSHFRLVTEAPAGAPALGEIFGGGRPRRGAPYKLFEVVPGAEIALRCEPGSKARVWVGVGSGRGRNFEWAATTEAGADGWARLRVPYATQPAGPAEARGAAIVRGPMRASCAARSYAFEVSLEAVRNGDTIELLDPS
jgi:dolichyl-diphosphooligosaccharide--protein glycosyltransferase